MNRQLAFPKEMLPFAANKNGNANKLNITDRAVHDWYRFVLSFPPHLVKTYIDQFNLNHRDLVIDPFCGTGTTIVECKKNGIPAIGFESNPMPHFASSVKIDWEINPALLLRHAREVAARAETILKTEGIINPPFQNSPIVSSQLRTLPADRFALLLKNSISPLPLHKVLTLLDCIETSRLPKYRNYEVLALANALVQVIGNLHFGPEVGVTEPKSDAPVISAWMNIIHRMVHDLHLLRDSRPSPACIHREDSRKIKQCLKPHSVSAVITSPPYPNEKDYTRTTRLESVILGFIKTKAELRLLKKTLIRSNTRGVYKDDADDKWIADNAEINRIAAAIEKRRIALDKTSGFERQYHRVVKLYFGGMTEHLVQLAYVLKPGALLAYVVGDQASYLRVMIRTGRLLAEIAEQIGYIVERIDLFRTRLSTATREQLREEVLILRWPGGNPKIPKGVEYAKAR